MNTLIEAIENEIMDTFKHNAMTFCSGEKEKKIFIESGALNDEIIDYELILKESVRSREREVSFKTTASVFPRTIKLSDYENVDTEEYNGNLFVHVS